jgi:signal transduction histidine kinase
VQEALTNVLRHAGPTSAEVDVEYREREVSVAVRDRGAGGAAGPGRGLGGLRQRVEELQGAFTAGERPTGGFEVVATIPHGGRT